MSGCGPEQYIWIIAGMGVGAFAGIMFVSWMLRRWIENGMPGHDGN